MALYWNFRQRVLTPDPCFLGFGLGPLPLPTRLRALYNYLPVFFESSDLSLDVFTPRSPIGGLFPFPKQLARNRIQ